MGSLSYYKRHFELWLKTHEHLARRGVVGLAIAAGLSIILQVAYPSARTLPFVNAGGAKVGAEAEANVAKELEAYYKGATLVVRTGDKATSQSLQEIGVDIDYKATAKEAAGYSLWKRLVPFSSIGIMLGRDTRPVSHYDKERITYFAKTIQNDTFIPAKNAGAAAKKGKAVLVPAEPSTAYPAADIVKIIYDVSFTDKTTVHIDAKHTPATRTDKQVKTVLSKVQTMIDRPITTTLPSQKENLSKETLVSWIDFKAEPAGKLSVVVNEDAVAQYVAGIKAKTDRAPGVTNVSIVDGVEASRNSDGDGLGVEAGPAVTYLISALNGSGSPDVVIPVTVVPAPIVYNRSYSQTSKGLGVLLSDVSVAKGGYGMAVIELGGLGRSNSANGAKQFTSASTFKLFVAYGIFQRMASGSMHWSDIIYGGKNAEKCFDDMIVVSDNNCAIAFGNIVGWSNVNTMMKNIGLTHTQVTAGNHLTTADDLALFMHRLQAGTLVSGSDRTRLIEAMKRNIYRSGIPAGTGVTVADKVGFVDGYLNDAAIVYGPKATYIMIVMSKGSTWANIADATKQVYTYLNQ